MKKNIPYFIFVLLLLMCVGVNQPPPRHIYKNRQNSIFTERVMSFVNKQFMQKCDIKVNQYTPINETIRKKEHSFYFTLTITPKQSQARQGSFEIEEFHTGKLVLQRLECPGKNKQWLSFSNQLTKKSSPKRAIASEEE